MYDSSSDSDYDSGEEVLLPVRTQALRTQAPPRQGRQAPAQPQRSRGGRYSDDSYDDSYDDSSDDSGTSASARLPAAPASRTASAGAAAPAKAPAEAQLADLECVICLETLSQPVTLGCGHSLCRAPCLSELARGWRLRAALPARRAERSRPSRRSWASTARSARRSPWCPARWWSGRPRPWPRRGRRSRRPKRGSASRRGTSKRAAPHLTGRTPLTPKRCRPSRRGQSRRGRSRRRGRNLRSQAGLSPSLESSDPAKATRQHQCRQRIRRRRRRRRGRHSRPLRC